MANPVLVTCTEGTWTKVAENVLTGYIRQPASAISFAFWLTSRDTGEEATSNSDKTDGGKAQV